MRPIWTGSISFGLVNIPVKLFSATTESSLDLDMLDSHDHSNIKFKRVNENTGKEVPFKNIVKGYLYDDQYVVLDPEDFEAADAKKTKLIEIQNFVNDEEIDSLYYEQPYYIEPEKNGARAYAILRDALHDSKKVGVGTFVLRNKETIVILKSREKGIVLNRLRFAEEIRDMSELNLPPLVKAKPKEQAMAKQLIEELSEKFNIKEYRDTYTQKLLSIIKQKAKGKKPKTTKLKVVHTKSDDLMSMLKASLHKNKKAS